MHCTVMVFWKVIFAYVIFITIFPLVIFETLEVVGLFFQKAKSVYDWPYSLVHYTEQNNYDELENAGEKTARSI